MDKTGNVLAFDFGLARIGVALGNTVTQGARPLAIIEAKTNVAKWEGIQKELDAWVPAILIVGVPRHPDSTAHEMTQRALRFARQLAGRTGLPLYTVDERYSSVLVEEGTKKIDDASAAVILQQWFDEGCPKNGIE